MKEAGERGGGGAAPLLCCLPPPLSSCFPLPPTHPLPCPAHPLKDHFVGTFATAFPELLPPPGTAWPPPVVSDEATPTPDPRPEDGPGCLDVAVEAGPAGARARLLFRMQRGLVGRTAGAWVTAAVIREEEEE